MISVVRAWPVTTIIAGHQKIRQQLLKSLPSNGWRGIPGGVDELDLDLDRELQAHLSWPMNVWWQPSEVVVHRDTRQSSGKDDVFGSSTSRDSDRTALTTMREGG